MTYSDKMVRQYMKRQQIKERIDVHGYDSVLATLLVHFVVIGDLRVGHVQNVPGYADKLQGDDRDVLKLRPGITGPATLKYRLEDEYLANARKLVSDLNVNLDLDSMSDQEVAVWYNDNVIYPDKVRLNCYYYRHYSFIKDIQMILCTVLGKKMEYAGEVI